MCGGAPQAKCIYLEVRKGVQICVFMLVQPLFAAGLLAYLDRKLHYEER